MSRAARGDEPEMNVSVHGVKHQAATFTLVSRDHARCALLVSFGSSALPAQRSSGREGRIKESVQELRIIVTHK